MMTSLEPSSAALPAKQRPELMPMRGTRPLSFAYWRKVGVSRPATPGKSVSPGRPPPPSAKQDDGQLRVFRDLQQPILLAMVHRALRAGEHGVVVGQHRAARALLAELRGVHRADAGDDAVAGRVPDQIVQRAAALLCREGQRAVFDEAAGIDQIGDVLARRALVGLAAAGDGVGAVLIEAEAHGARWIPRDRAGSRRDRPLPARSPPRLRSLPD